MAHVPAGRLRKRSPAAFAVLVTLEVVFPLADLAEAQPMAVAKLELPQGRRLPASSANANSQNDLSFDCTENAETWDTSWSDEQKDWCCRNEARGCPQVPYNCRAAQWNYNTVWTTDHKAYCCQVNSCGCETYDCTTTDLPVAEWNLCRASYCCRTGTSTDPAIIDACAREPAQVTITSSTPPPPTCNENVQVSWTAEQRHWCCLNEHKGCQGCGAPCNDTTGTVQTCSEFVGSYSTWYRIHHQFSGQTQDPYALCSQSHRQMDSVCGTNCATCTLEEVCGTSTTTITTVTTTTATTTTITTTTTPVPSQTIMTGSLDVTHVDLNVLESTPQVNTSEGQTLKDGFELTCRNALASAAQTAPANVAVVLAEPVSGTVRVTYTIYVAESVGAVAEQSLEAAIAGGTLASNLIASLSAIQPISAATTGDMAATSFTSPVIRVAVSETSTTGAPGATTTTQIVAELISVITGSLRVNNLDFANLSSDAALRENFVTNCAQQIALGAGTDREHVHITLSAGPLVSSRLLGEDLGRRLTGGSVNVNYEIQVPENQGAPTQQSLAAFISNGNLASGIDTAVASIPNIQNAATGAMTTTDVSSSTLTTQVAATSTTVAAAITNTTTTVTTSTSTTSTMTSTTSTTSTTTSTTTTITTSTSTTSGQFDCATQGQNVQDWAYDKRAWCCLHYHVAEACHPVLQPHEHSGPYNCHHEPIARWSSLKRSWCCSNKRLGCEAPAYNCHAGISNWQVGWSDTKKVWCCEEANVGCGTKNGEPGAEPYDCQAGFMNFEADWSDEKKRWCCENYAWGCQVTQAAEPYDCQAGLSNWRLGWSPQKKEWCCNYKQLGCASGSGWRRATSVMNDGGTSAPRGLALDVSPERVTLVARTIAGPFLVVAVVVFLVTVVASTIACVAAHRRQAAAVAYTHMAAVGGSGRGLYHGVPPGSPGAGGSDPAPRSPPFLQT